MKHISLISVLLAALLGGSCVNNFDMYQITVEPADPQMGTTTGSGIYHQGEQVTIKADAYAAWAFDQWIDGNTDNPRTVTVTEDAKYVAYFKQNVSYSVTFGTSTWSGVHPSVAYYKSSDQLQGTLHANPVGYGTYPYITMTIFNPSNGTYEDNQAIINYYQSAQNSSGFIVYTNIVGGEITFSQLDLTAGQCNLKITARMFCVDNDSQRDLTIDLNGLTFGIH